MPAAQAPEPANRRALALLLAGALLPVAACTSGDDGLGAGSQGGGSGAARDVPHLDREQVADGGTLRWAVDGPPRTLNAFRPGADATTERVAQATLPSLFTLDAAARPQLNPDYAEAADVTATEPRQTVVYRLNPGARWDSGRRIGVADFTAQWKALNGKRSSFGAARNTGYDRIAKVTEGEGPREVKVVFREPYADWKSLFTPLYPKSVTARAADFKRAARTSLPESAGPFRVQRIGRGEGSVTLVRDKKWWGDRAKLRRIVLRAVPRDERKQALRHGKLDLAEVDVATVRGIVRAHKDEQDAKALSERKAAKSRDGKSKDETERKDSKSKDGERKDEGTDKDRSRGEERGEERRKSDAKPRASLRELRRQLQRHGGLRHLAVRHAFEPAYTQLALNGSEGPLADERVRRAVARAIDRQGVAEHALRGTGLPVKPLGSHLRMIDQDGYADNSDALGEQDVESAQSLLAEAGWQEAPVAGGTDAKKGERAPGQDRKAGDARKRSEQRNGEQRNGEQRNGEQKREQSRHGERGHGQQGQGQQGHGNQSQGQQGHRKQGEKRGGKHSRVSAPRVKAGKPLTLRFVLPAGRASKSVRATGARIAKELQRIGVRTRVQQVSADRYFANITAGSYDLAIYSWPGTAFPATDARPIFAKPSAAADGSLLVEQNYTRVGTNQIDQLFEQASRELDDGVRNDLIKRADARIWAAAGSVPLYQRPQLVAAGEKVANAGAFGFQTPRYQDIGFEK